MGKILVSDLQMVPVAGNDPHHGYLGTEFFVIWVGSRRLHCVIDMGVSKKAIYIPEYIDGFWIGPIDC